LVIQVDASNFVNRVNDSIFKTLREKTHKSEPLKKKRRQAEGLTSRGFLYKKKAVKITLTERRGEHAACSRRQVDGGGNFDPVDRGEGISRSQNSIYYLGGLAQARTESARVRAAPLSAPIQGPPEVQWVLKVQKEPLGLWSCRWNLKGSWKKPRIGSDLESLKA